MNPQLRFKGNPAFLWTSVTNYQWALRGFSAFCIKALEESLCNGNRDQDRTLLIKFFSFSSLITIRVALHAVKSCPVNMTPQLPVKPSINNQFNIHIYIPSCLLNGTETLSESLSLLHNLHHQLLLGQVSHHEVAMEMPSVLVLLPFAAKPNANSGNEYLILFPAAVPPQRDRRKK